MSGVDDDLLVERYKHVLTQMGKIDANAHSFLVFYQASVTALIGAGGALWLLRAQWGVTAAVARQGIAAALVLILGLGVMTVVILLIGMVAWMDYRREEADLAELTTTYRRGQGTWANLWRWQETYMILLVVLVTVAVVCMSWAYVFPSLAS